MKDIANKHGFATNNKEYKANKDAYKGQVGDIAEMLRITLCNKKNAPNLYCVMVVLGRNEVNRRIDKVTNLL